MEAAPGARRWLACNATAVKTLLRQGEPTSAAACTSLIVCLPALEHVHLEFERRYSKSGDLGHLLEALASCPRLKSLGLSIRYPYQYINQRVHPNWMLPSLAPFAQLRSLTKLSLDFYGEVFYPLADVVRALVSLTGLVELHVGLTQTTVVPAALGQLTGLQSLSFKYFESCVLEAGCFDLPNLLSLEFFACMFEDAELLASIPALPSLTRIEFFNGSVPPFFAQLLLLPQLQHLKFLAEYDVLCVPDHSNAYLGLPRLPAGSVLLHLDLINHGLTQFPLVLTQLVALEHLDVSENAFAELPVTITALSRLTELTLGRLGPSPQPPLLHELPPLDVSALGDLSAFPALCELNICNCEVTLPSSLLGVTRHASRSFPCVQISLRSARRWCGS